MHNGLSNPVNRQGNWQTYWDETMISLAEVKRLWLRY